MGELRAPRGESWVVCTCGSNVWLLTKRKSDDAPGRAICARCKNEIMVVKHLLTKPSPGVH